MLPAELKPEQFRSYPPEARSLALNHLATLRELPLSFLANFLRELVEYDYQFPAERKTLQAELAYLRSLSRQEREELFREFTAIRISPKLERMDWVGAPAQFVEQLSADLWTTGQLDAFRKAALDYANRLRDATSPDPPVTPRLTVVVIGKGADSAPEPLFRKLRSHGAYFNNISPENGLEHLLNVVETRAKANAQPYSHWYIDGGPQRSHDTRVTGISYAGLEPVRTALLARIESETKKSGMGPESLRSVLAGIRPSDLGLTLSGDAVLDRFQVKLLTEGSGTQIFSTSFVQWAAREALRRAQPLTLLVRFVPRQRPRPMNELLSPTQQPVEVDPSGSLLDADMAAYYCWLNQQRLSGASQSMFLAWFEDHSEGVAISPAIPRGTQSNSSVTMEQLLSWLA